MINDSGLAFNINRDCDKYKFMGVYFIGIIMDCNLTVSLEISDKVTDPKNYGIKSGYAPHDKFKNVDYLVSGYHKYEDDDFHYPGETIKAEISFPSWAYFCKSVSVGEKFEVLELDRIIGYGIVESIDLK